MIPFVGFIGSHAAILLCKKYPQYNIVVFDRLDYCSCLKNLDELQDLPNFKFIKGDIAVPDIVNYAFLENKIDTIMHFAAQTHVDNSFGNSLASGASSGVVSTPFIPSEAIRVICSSNRRTSAGSDTS